VSRLTRVPVSVTWEIDRAELSRRGKIGAHRLHALHDSREITASARAKFLSRFEEEVDPTGELPPEERRRRAAHARKAYFARLARLSAIARRKPDPSLPTVTKEAACASA
jgi:hypothetical protein